MTSGFHLTFDVDWAPDWSVRETLAMLEDANAKATFFITHKSPTIDEILSKGHEVGIHPNFQAGSTQGAHPVEVVGRLLDLLPEARAIRTHGLVQGSLLFTEVLSAFPALRYDLSILTYKFPHTGWFDWHLGGTHMRRINYVWEDDFAFEDPVHDWSEYVPMSDVDILDFHPIHVSLNSNSGVSYTRVKKTLGSRPLNKLSQDEGMPYRETGPGTQNFLSAILRSPYRCLSFEEVLCV